MGIIVEETLSFFVHPPDRRKSKKYIDLLLWTFSVIDILFQEAWVFHFRLQTCNYIHENECPYTEVGPLKSSHWDEGNTFPLQKRQCESLGKEMWLGTKDFFFFPQSHFRSDITLALSKLVLSISFIYLYYSVSRPCLWFLMQNSTQLLNLWSLSLCFIFDQILFLHQSYKIFSKGRINISLVYSTTANITVWESIFFVWTV